MKRRVLVVDDEDETRELLRDLLERAGYAVTALADPAEAFAEAAASKPDLVLSDVAMPGMTGVALCRRLKADPRTAAIPIILLSGVRRGDAEQARGIEQGADDYVLKPYAPRLLLAKIKAVQRRFDAPAELKETLEAEGLALDVYARTVRLRGRAVGLTRKEFDLLTALLRLKGRVAGVAYLLEHVWGYDPNDYAERHTVESHVSTLRRKLGARWAKRIVSVPGLGYRFDAAK